MPLPPTEKKEPTTASNVELPTSMWAELDEVATKEKERQGRYVPKKEIIAFFLRWAIDDYWREVERAEKKHGK